MVAFKPNNHKSFLVTYGESIRLLPRGKKHQQNLLRTGFTPRQDEPSMYSIVVCLATFGLISASCEPMAVNLMAAVKHLTVAGGRAIGSESHDTDYWLPCTIFLPNVIGGLVAAMLCNLYPRSQLLGGIAVLASSACFLVAGTGAGHFASRALAGFSMGGAVPIIYSLCGDWFAAAQRVKICAVVSAISSGCLLLGQSIAAAFGPARRRASCLLLAAPTLAAGLITLQSGEDPVRAGKEYFFEAFRRHERSYSAVFSLSRAVRSIAEKRTNLLVLLQSFPGDVVLGIGLASLNGFVQNELQLPPESARVGAMVTLAAAFMGMLAGGFIGEALYVMQPRYLALFSGACCILRVLPLMLLITAQYWNPAKHEMLLFVLLGTAGASMTLGSPCLSSMLLNVNPAETRGLVVGLQAFLSEVSKALGAFCMVLATEQTGTWAPGQRGAVHASATFGFEMICWCASLLSALSGIALLAACFNYEEDEAQLKEQFETAARQQKVRATKQQAQMAVQRLARAAGEAHHTECKQAHAVAADAESPATAMLLRAQSVPPNDARGSWQQWRVSIFGWLQDQYLAWSVVAQLR